MRERLEKITMDWLLMEPALLKVLMSHNVTENSAMQCAMRCGERRIEYNPTLCQVMSDKKLEEMLKVECIRILLKHPYTRQPQGCSPQAIILGSNCVVKDNYSLKYLNINSPADFGLDKGQHFEFYARQIQQMLPQSQSKGQGNSDSGSSNNSTNKAENSDGSGQENSQNDLTGQSSLWKEDPMAAAEINEMIHSLEASHNWGSLSNNLMGQIIASTKVKIDYRRIIQSFRADVLSSKRQLTRMRPNRRSGFENFGSVYRLTSRLLVAVDASGSTTDQMVSDFFGIINKFFKYGIEEVDVIQFDALIKGDPMPMKKAKKGGINIIGRGGTSFQPVIDFAAEKKHYYQGLIILTDGYADSPTLPSYFNTPILWVLPSEAEYQEHKAWMKKFGKVCFIEIKG